MARLKVKIKILRKRFRYWYPGTDVVNEIVNKYGMYIDNGDILVLSEKALAIALGNIYDENVIDADIFTKTATFFTMRILWGNILKFVFKNPDIVKIIKSSPLNVIAVHKKLGLRYGGFKHFLKPISEAGIDTTNLPYKYVSLPLKNSFGMLNNIRMEVFRRLGKVVNILVIDSDKTFKPKKLRYIAFSTRISSVKGVIDLGAYAYFVGKVFKKYFTPYPTPVAYVGIDLSLPLILRIAKVCSKYMGSGLGRNFLEMVRNLNVEDFNKIKWIDMVKTYHYPAVLAKLKILRQLE